LQVLIVSLGTVDEHVVLCSLRYQEKNRDQQAEARHHCGSRGYWRQVAGVCQLHSQLLVAATYYGAAFFRRSHAEGPDAPGAHKATCRSSAETDLQFGDVHKSDSAEPAR
jgi:hypothetical protein